MSSAESVFKVEYARSDRSTCKSCRTNIDKETFRFGIFVQSSKFDGKVPQWYHTDCFFKKVKLFDLKLIKGFDELRWDDQEKLRKLVEENAKTPSNGVVPTDAFSVQYAKSSRSTCRACRGAIEKNLIRISRKNYISRRARKFGPQDDWYHFDCFAEQRKDLGFFGTAKSFVGFDQLNNDDQKLFEAKFDDNSTTTTKRKRRGKDVTNDEKRMKTDDEQTQLRKEQSELLWKYKDALKNEITQDVMKKLLEHNSQKLVTGEANLIESVADCLAFGALEACPECGGSLVFNYTNYRCTGNLTEWTKCSYSTASPVRKPLEIPEEFQDDYEIFENYEYTKRDRIMMQTTRKNQTNESNFDVKRPLRGMSIFLTGRLSKKPKFYEEQIKALGGMCEKRLVKRTDVVISTQKTLDKKTYHIVKAEEFAIPVVSETFLDEIQLDRPSIAIDKTKLSSWGKSKEVRKSLSRKTNRWKTNEETKVTMKLKGGAAVDPDSGLAETCHIVKDPKSGTFYTAVLGMVDITRGTNSYYKIQLLEEDSNKHWHLFRA